MPTHKTSFGSQALETAIQSWSYIFVNKEFSHTILENLSLSSLWGEKDLIADERIYHIYPKNVKSKKISSSVFIFYFANKISKPFLCNDYEMIETKPIWNTLKTPSSEWSLRVSGSHSSRACKVNKSIFLFQILLSFTSHRFLSSLQNIKLSLCLSLSLNVISLPFFINLDFHFSWKNLSFFRWIKLFRKF